MTQSFIISIAIIVIIIINIIIFELQIFSWKHHNDWKYYSSPNYNCRGGSRAAATSKMEYFVIIINGFQPLTIITKCSIFDVAAVLHPPLGQN